MPNILILLISLHFLGDYYLQTKKIAEYKEVSLLGVIIHSICYSIPCLLSLVFVDGSGYLILIAIMCGAHLVIDCIKFYIKPSYYSPDSNKNEDGIKNHVLKVDLRYFADQLFHLAAITAISLWFLQNHADISINPTIRNAFNISTETLAILFKAVAAFIIVLQPVSLTFYRIFNIEVLAHAKIQKNSDETGNHSIDIKGTGAIIGFMERIIILFLLMMGEYTAIGFVIAGKSIIRLNSNVSQEFYIIGTFYGIITTIVSFLLFFKI
jgi:hypothetical protein